MASQVEQIKRDERELRQIDSSSPTRGREGWTPNSGPPLARMKEAAMDIPDRSDSRTPPSIPTPPWLSSPLPSQSGSDHGHSTAVSADSTPSTTRTGSYSKYYRSRMAEKSQTTHTNAIPPLPPPPPPAMVDDGPEATTGVTGDGVATSPRSIPRVRSMSPPELEKEVPQEARSHARPGSSTLQALGPLTCTTLSVHDALMLRCQLYHDPNRLNVLINILKSMADLMMPNHDMVWNLLVVTEGGYNCPFPSCARHRDGWTRADRTRAHIYADHLMIRYKCDRCNSYFKREQDFNIHVASHDKQPSFECPLCTKTFPKKFNLNRHLRQIHDQRSLAKANQTSVAPASTPAPGSASTAAATSSTTSSS